jgi:hypothetical protein
MAKNKPGLPDGFEINLNNPVELGDYLDEDFSGNTAKVIAAKRASAPKPEPVKVINEPTPPPPPKPQVLETALTLPQKNETVLDLAEARRRSAPKQAPFRRPERIQCNMRPETVKMFNDVVEFVQRYSLQNDAKASEIFDALISVLHDSKEELAFNDVPRRGKWGTPTARAFPTALGNAFARAIASRYSKQQTE